MPRSPISVVDPDSGLTELQVAFCRAYVKTYRIDEAERAAGASDGYGSDLLKVEKVQEYIRKLASAATKRAKVDAVRVLQRSWEIGNSDISMLENVASLSDLRKMPGSVRRAVKRIKQREFLDKEGNTVKIETEIEMHAKMPALQLLAVATGAVTQRDLNNVDTFEGFTIITPPALPKPEGGA